MVKKNGDILEENKFSFLLQCSIFLGFIFVGGGFWVVGLVSVHFFVCFVLF